MPIKLKLILFAICFGIISGCATIGNDFPNNYALQIALGKTSRTDVEKILGKPYRTGSDSGDSTSTYLYYRVGLFTTTVAKDLTIRFSENGFVKSYTFNTNNFPIESE